MKQPIHNVKRKIIRIVVLGVCFLLIVLIGFIGTIKLHQYYDRNPYLTELQQIVAKQYGTDFSVVMNCSEDEKISVIEIESTDDVYLRADVFSKVDNLQKKIFEYVMQNQEQFCYINSIRPEDDSRYQQEMKGLELHFINSEYTNSSGLLNVFCFYNNIEYIDENAEGFNSLMVCTDSRGSDSHYSNIRTSALVNFKDVNYIDCWYTNVDDTSFIKKIENLKEISVGPYDEEIRKAAEEAGIKCN